MGGARGPIRKRCTYQIMVRTTDRKRPLEKSRHRQEGLLKKQDMAVWIGFIWQRTGSSGGLF
jgi:hypothetical protein